MKIKYLTTSPLKILNLFFFYIISGSILSVNLGILDVGPRGLFRRLVFDGNVIMGISGRSGGILLSLTKFLVQKIY